MLTAPPVVLLSTTAAATLKVENVRFSVQALSGQKALACARPYGVPAPRYVSWRGLPSR